MHKKHIRAVPRELFAVERLHLKPLPTWIPEVYRLHQCLVDIEIQPDARRLVTNRRVAEAEHQRITLAEHRPPGGQRSHVPIRIPKK